jgi:aryl-alcohol dehydrogenase-like predicted oxidoreductase
VIPYSPLARGFLAGDRKKGGGGDTVRANSDKLAAVDDAEALTGLVRDVLPELSGDEAWRYWAGAWVMTSALWAYAHPPQAVVEACASDERLAAAHLDFPVALEDYLTTLAIGLHARHAHIAR